MFLYCRPDPEAASLIGSNPVPSTVPIIRNDVAHSNPATFANTGTTLDTCDEGNQTVEENMGKLSAEYSLVKRRSSNSNDSFYSAKNECNLIEVAAA